jgi:hypothetical protein
VRRETGDRSGGTGVVECWNGGVVEYEETAEKVSRPLRYSCANFLRRGCGGGIRVGDEHREVFSYSGSWLLTPELAPDS